MAPVHLKILIVDDNAAIRRALRGILLESHGWTVCGEAENGSEAISKAADLKPDVIIMDVSMPQLDGLGATRIILKAAPCTGIIILSQHPASVFESLAIGAGACAYVEKSEIARALLPAIEAAGRHDGISRHGSP
jgi:two-component system, NarL family, response regulator NreC